MIFVLRRGSRTGSVGTGVVSRLGDRLAVGLDGDALRLRSAANAGVERVNGRNLFAGKLEVEDVEVLGDARRVGRLRDRGAARLQVPAKHHLRGGLAVPAPDLDERRVVERALRGVTVGRDPADGRLGLRDDAILGVHPMQFGLLEIGVDLDLIHGGDDGRLAQQAFEVRGHRYRYDPFHYLLVTVELPVVGRVLVASVERPFLGLVLMLDAALISSVMVEAGCAAPQSGTSVRALDVSPLSTNLLNAVVRLVRLLDAPDEVPILAPLIKREIVYRLLQGAQSSRLRHIATLNGGRHRITRALKRLHESFDQPLRIESLAEELGMSTSSFYAHFKAVTDMTPLQFQKQLQLQEARRLMLSEELDAATAGYRVGYNDASQFNREYKRLFGRPPVRDVERLREAMTKSTR